MWTHSRFQRQGPWSRCRYMLLIPLSHWIRRATGSCSFVVLPRRSTASSFQLIKRQEKTGEEPNGAEVLFPRSPGASDTTSNPQAKELLDQKAVANRCPDFPSFAAKSKSSGIRVRLNDEETLLKEQPPMMFRLLAELPVEPGLFVSVGDVARRTRLLTDRCYANKEAFQPKNARRPPGLSDLVPPRPRKFDTFWISIPARMLSFGIPFASFPYIITTLADALARNVVDSSELTQIAADFAPGVAILYGTFLSLTLSVLYNRQQNLQDDIASETSLLMYLTRMLMTVFREDQDGLVKAGQCCADQVRTLVQSSRGNEMTMIMYSDPYARIMEIIEQREAQLICERDGELGGYGLALGNCRDTLRDIIKIRSKRLSDEALFLPPTHFFVLTTLTCLILLGYCVTVLATVVDNNSPSLESSLLFGILCSVYIFFYNFANDLNNPFEGVYTIRRSSCASHLLETKFLLANHPSLRGQIDFDAVQEQAGQYVRIRSPGLGDMWFSSEDVYPEPR